MGRVLVAAAMCLISGCYLFHERSAEDRPTSRDAGTARRDADRRPTRDAGPWTSDAGTGWSPPPDAGEEDLGPDARPSDYPEADEWEEPPAEPPIGDSDPCCALGDVVVIDDTHINGGNPAVGFHGTGWGILWEAHGDGWFYRELSPAAGRAGPMVTLTGAPATPRVSGSAIEWAAGRYGIVAGAFNEMTASGDRLGHWTTVSQPMQDLARYRHGGWWLAAGSTGGRVIVEGMTDASGAVTGAVLDEEADEGVRIVGLASRAAVVWPIGGEVWQQSFTWPDPSPSPPLRVAAVDGISDMMVDAVRLRDTVVVSAIARGHVWITVTDPWDGRVLHGPVAVTTSAIGDRRAALAASDKHGYLGACVPTGPGPYGGGPASEAADGVKFQLLGPEGRPWGHPVTLREGLRNIGGCAVGHDGERFAVAWWRAAGDPITIEARLVTPRL